MQDTQLSAQNTLSKLVPSGRRAWPALIFGVLAATLAAWVVGSGSAAVVFLLLGALPYALLRWPAWWIGIFHRAPELGAVATASYWQDWVPGWYWQTDAEHRLRVLKPDHADAHGWLIAQHWCSQGATLWQCWNHPAAAEAEPSRVLLSMLEMRMKSHLPISLDPLPWPLCPHGGEGTGAAAGLPSCQVKGQPRLGPQGEFLGYEGVWLRVTGALGGAAVHDDLAHEHSALMRMPPAIDAVATPSALPPAATSPALAGQAGQTSQTDPSQEVLRYALSHDLRAPLRVVDGFARILKEDYAKHLDRIGNDHLDRVLTAAARMNAMIDAILMQAQLAQAPLVLEQVAISRLAREVADEQVGARLPQAQGGQPPPPVVLEVAEGLTAMADAALLRRVLDNLIGNALKYSSKVSEVRIEIGMVPATDPAVYFVRDNGAGFDMQHADKLFGLFQRLHSTKEFPGSGVGLAGVQNIIHRHGGRVWAEAAPGQGACFYFTLKPTVADAALKAAGASAGTLPGRGTA